MSECLKVTGWGFAIIGGESVNFVAILIATSVINKVRRLICWIAFHMETLWMTSRRHGG